MNFYARRPTVKAAQFLGDTTSISNVLALVDNRLAPSYTLTNHDESLTLTIKCEDGDDVIMRYGDWYVLEKEQYGVTHRVMDEREFRRMYEAADPEAVPGPLVHVPDPAAELHALQVRGTALEAALRISASSGDAGIVTSNANMFHAFLTGSTQAAGIDLVQHAKDWQAASDDELLRKFQAMGKAHIKAGEEVFKRGLTGAGQ